MDSPYTVMPEARRTLLQRALGRPSPANAFIKINNLLAKGVMETRPEEVEAILMEHAVRPGAKTSAKLEEIYRVFVQHCLADNVLTSTEIAEVFHLRTLLGISDAAHQRILGELGERTYREAVEGALEDGQLSEDEEGNLKRLRESIGLPEKAAQKIFAEQAQTAYQSALDAAVADERLSPEEESNLEALAQNLGIEVQYSEKTEAFLNRLKLYYALENGPLPQLNPRVALQRNEICVFETEVDWFEKRTVTKRVRFAGPTARLRIAKGIYFRAGEFAVQPVAEDVLKHIDKGTAFFTNKRVLFLGQRKNTSIRLSKILAVNAYSNGLLIEKDAGKSPFLSFSVGVDIGLLLLNRVLNEQRG